MKSYFYLLLVGFLWGSQFIFMHQAVAEYSPMVVAAGRAMFGATTLALLCLVLKLKADKTQWGLYMLIALLDATLPFVLIASGQQHVDSAIAAVLMGTIPFVTILLAPLVIKGETLNRWGLNSVILGFIGVLMLFSPQIMGGAQAGLMASVMILIGASCFGLGMLIIKKYASGHPIIVARNILICSAVQLTVIGSFTTDFSQLTFEPSGVMAIALLGIFCTGLVYFLFMALIQLSGPSFASFSNYLVPLFGVVLGAVLLGEQIASTTILSLVIILSSVALYQWAQGRETEATG